MKDFGSYTEEKELARRRRWVWAVPVAVLVAALVVVAGVRAGAGPLVLQTLGSETDGDPAVSGGAEDGAGWVDGLLGRPSLSDEPLNVLVLGVDKRPGDEVEGSSNRSDTMLLVQVTPESGEVEMLSVPRDLLVEVEPGVEDRINTAYAYGGIDQSVSVFEDFTDVPVDRYAIVDFMAFRRVVDAMGGVEVNADDEIPSRFGIEDGIQTLNGREALIYARYRGTSGGDLDRIQRQRQVVAALRSKALKWDSVTKLPQIVRVMERNVETDLSARDGVFLGRALIKQGRNASMKSVQLQGTPDTLSNGDQVLVPDNEANEEILREFRY